MAISVYYRIGCICIIGYKRLLRLQARRVENILMQVRI